MDETPRSSGAYSRAFENFVQHDDDLAGLLAYALYKKSIREAGSAGKSVPLPSNRDPSPAEQLAYRSLARNLLDAFGESAQVAAKDAILDGGFRPDWPDWARRWRATLTVGRPGGQPSSSI